MNIYVGNLSWTRTDDELMNLFTQYGSVTSAKILKDKMNGRSKGFGFVEMADDEAAKTAIANLNETEVQGRKLIVNNRNHARKVIIKNAALAAEVVTKKVAVATVAETVVVVATVVETVVAEVVTTKIIDLRNKKQHFKNPFMIRNGFLFCP